MDMTMGIEEVEEIYSPQVASPQPSSGKGNKCLIKRQHRHQLEIIPVPSIDSTEEMIEALSMYGHCKQCFSVVPTMAFAVKHSAPVLDTHSTEHHHTTSVFSGSITIQGEWWV